MKIIVTLSRLAVVAIAIAGLGSVAAKDLRYPEKGDVAFVLHFPDEVNTRDDGIGNLIVTSPDRTWALSLARGDDSLSAKSIDAVAEEVLVAAKAEPFSAHEPAMIGDKKATAYLSRMTNPGGTNINVKLVITKIDRSYVTESILTAASITASQRKLLDRTLDGISLTGTK